MCYKKQQEKYPVNRLGALTKHHLRPRSKGGLGLPDNISHVPEKLHNAYHLLFLNHSPTKIAHILNNHWIDSDYTMIAVHKDDIEAVNDFISSRGLSKYWYPLTTEDYDWEGQQNEPLAIPGRGSTI